jgi:hypothetical protein
MTYYDWQITHSEVMSWVSRKAEILIHQRDSRVGSENSIESEQISAELPCLSYSEDSQQARKSYSPQNLASLCSKKNELGSTLGS